MEASQVTEKMVNDKCMEITGRVRQEGRAVVLSEKMVKNTTDQTPAPSSGQRPTTMSTAAASQRLAPTCTERRNQGHLDNEALAKATPKRTAMRARAAPLTSAVNEERVPIDLEDQEVREWARPCTTTGRLNLLVGLWGCDRQGSGQPTSEVHTS